MLSILCFRPGLWYFFQFIAIYAQPGGLLRSSPSDLYDQPSSAYLHLLTTSLLVYLLVFASHHENALKTKAKSHSFHKEGAGKQIILGSNSPESTKKVGE